MVSFVSFMRFFSLGVGSAAAVLNTVVFLLVASLKGSMVGPYRILLMLYLLMNIFCSLVTTIFNPMFSINETEFAIFGPGLSGNQKIYSLCMVGFCFTIIGLIVVLCFSYIYRYFAICSQQRLRLFSDFRGLTVFILISLGFFATFTACSMIWMMPNAVKSHLFEPHFIEHFGPVNMYSISYMGAVSYKDDTLDFDFGLMFIIRVVCLVLPLSVIVICAGLIACSLKKQFALMSSSAHVTTRQYKLFILLILQTTCPILLLYTPLTILYLASLLRYKDFLLCDAISISVTLAQLFDPFIVLCCVSDYRRAAVKLLKKVSSYRGSFVESSSLPATKAEYRRPSTNGTSNPQV